MGTLVARRRDEGESVGDEAAEDSMEERREGPCEVEVEGDGADCEGGSGCAGCPGESDCMGKDSEKRLHVTISDDDDGCEA